MSTLVNQIFETSAIIDDDRSSLYILAHAMEELGELSQEVIVAQGTSYKHPGKDGIIGEAVDAIICILDLVKRTHPKITEGDLQAVATAKLQKWVDTTTQIQQNWN